MPDYVLTFDDVQYCKRPQQFKTEIHAQFKFKATVAFNMAVETTNSAKSVRDEN